MCTRVYTSQQISEQVKLCKEVLVTIVFFYRLFRVSLG